MDNQVQNGVVQLNCKQKSDPIYNKNLELSWNFIYFFVKHHEDCGCHRKLETSYITSNYFSEESCPHED